MTQAKKQHSPPPPLATGTSLSIPQMEPLTPLPIHFDEANHKYQCLTTGRWMPFSITRVVNTKTPAEMERINQTKYGTEQQPELGWAYSGSYLHGKMEQFLLTGTPGELAPWATEYILPAVNNPIWETLRAVATEYRVIDADRGIAGSFDCLLQSRATGRLMLLDFKSQRSLKAKPYKVELQLGGYLDLLLRHHSFEVHRLAVGWLRPGGFQLEVLKTEPAEAIASYQAARDLFLEANVPF